MPPARKSCQRCRAHKAKCIWTEDSIECVRCKRSNHPCVRPDGIKINPKDPTPPQNYDFDGSEGSSAHLADVIDFELDHGTRILLNANDLPWNPPSTTFSAPRTDSNDFTTEQMPFVVASCAKLNCLLPEPDEGQVLLSEFLHDFNSRLPIFAPEALIELYKGCYSGENNDKPLAWVLVYATLALTHRMRAMSLFAAATDTPQAEYYLNKSLSKLPELLMGPPSLKLVQALASMCLLLETSNKCHRAPLFASTAVHMAEDLGYNELGPADPASNPANNEPYYVFWICFDLDAHLSLVSQRPTTTILANISSPMPPDSILDWWKPVPATASEWNVNIFAQHCSLAVIEAEASQDLFSAAARRQPATALVDTYANVMTKLTSWRARSALSRLEAQDVLKAMYRSDIVHSVMLEASYFRTLYQCYATKMLVGFERKVDVFTPEALQGAFERRDSACYDDARRLLNLIALLPQGNLCTTWASIQAIVAAACTILSAHSLRDQEMEQARVSDVDLCHHVLQALETAAACGIDPALGAAIGQCRQVYILSTSG